MAESLPVVTVPRDDDSLGPEGLSPDNIVHLHEVVVEELPMVEFEGFDSIDTTPFAVVTEPSEISAEDVIVIGSSGEEEGGGEEEVEEVEEVEEIEEVEEVENVGAERRGMASQAGIHPVTVPSELPIDDVPPDDTIPAFPVDDEMAPEAQNEAVVVAGDGDEEVRVSSEELVTAVEEVEVVVEVGVMEVVAEGKVEEVVTEEVTVKVNEVLLEKETVEEAMETEGEKGEKKRLREGKEEEEEAVKKLKSEEAEEAVKKLETEEDVEDVEKLESEEDEEAAKKLKSEEDFGKVVEPKKLGPKIFTTAVEMFSYFYNLLHDWNINQNLNKYEFMVLRDLVSQGNPQKIGNGIAAIQVRLHPKWQSRCYFVIHEDGSEDDFSYRKCCDALMPLPASLYRKNGELNLEKLFPGQKSRHHRESQQQQNGGGRGGGRGDHRGGRGRFGGRGGGGRGGRGGFGGGRRGGRGRW